VNETILVTGAAGFAGSHLLDLLETGPATVVAWRRPGDPLPADRSGDELPWMSVDLLDAEAVRAAVARTRPRAIYHCAGAAHVGHSWDRTHETLAVNVLGTYHLIEAVRRAGLASRILIPGSALVYRQSGGALGETNPVGPSSPYGFSKLAQEMLGARGVTEAKLPILLTRSFNHIGPRQAPSFFASSFARQIATIEAGRSEPVMVVGNLDARRDLSDVRDTIRAYQAIVERGRPGVIYNVCSGRAHAIGEILDGLLAQAQASITVRVDPALFRPNDNPLVVGNNARIREELGWTPTIPIERTLRDLLDFWRGTLKAATRDT
jgi:GDP-4-dehydro-6-deoxy-D-mannose reductase